MSKPRFGAVPRAAYTALYILMQDGEPEKIMPGDAVVLGWLADTLSRASHPIRYLMGGPDRGS